MDQDANPYQSPTSDGQRRSPPKFQRSRLATLLLIWWCIEGSVKAGFLVLVLSRGRDPLASLSVEYHHANAATFLFFVWFFVLETIGPLIGVYYLTGERARSIAFNEALLRILTFASVAALAIAGLLALICEVFYPVGYA